MSNPPAQWVRSCIPFLPNRAQLVVIALKIRGLTIRREVKPCSSDSIAGGISACSLAQNLLAGVRFQRRKGPSKPACSQPDNRRAWATGAGPFLEPAFFDPWRL